MNILASERPPYTYTSIKDIYRSLLVLYFSLYSGGECGVSVSCAYVLRYRAYS